MSAQEQRGAAAGEGGGNVSCCEGWEHAGQWKGQLPCSERGPDQDKQQTAGMESRVPRQSQRKETGIVGTRATIVSDLMQGPSATGHAGWPRTPLCLESAEPETTPGHASCLLWGNTQAFGHREWAF